MSYEVIFPKSRQLCHDCDYLGDRTISRNKTVYTCCLKKCWKLSGKAAVLEASS